MLADIAREGGGSFGETLGLKTQSSLVAALHQFACKEAVLTVFHIVAKERAVLHVMVHRQQSRALVERQAARQAHDVAEGIFNILEKLVADPVFHRLHARQPVVIGIRHEHAAANSINIGGKHVSYQGTQCTWFDNYIGIHRHDQVRVSFQNRILDANALADVLLVPDYCHPGIGLDDGLQMFKGIIG